MNEAAKKYIAENYGTMKPKEIAEALGKTQDWVRQIARRMGLFRGKGYRAEPRTRCKGCVIFCNGECLARLDRCEAAKYTRASWENLKKIKSIFD